MLLVILSLFAFILHARLELINITKIIGLTEINTLYQYIKTNEALLINPVPDEYWSYKISKDELIEKLTQLYTRLENSDIYKKNKINQEYYLFKGLIAHYLHNLFQEEYYVEAVNNYQFVENLKEKDYRYKWLLGNHYSKSNLPEEAIFEFEQTTISYPNFKFPSSFWYDFAWASFYAMMPSHAQYYLLEASKSNDFNQIESSLYQYIHKNMIFPDFGEKINKENLYVLLKRKGGIGFLSRLFGLWMPIKESWKYKIVEYHNNGSGFMFFPDPYIDKKGKSIGYSINVFCKVNNKQGLNDLVNSLMSGYPEKKKIPNISKKYDFIIYQYENPRVYENTGGGKGYFVFLEREEPAIPGFNIEKPSSIYTLDELIGDFQYYTLNKSYRRFAKPIYYIIFLDTVGQIFNMSEKVFFDFVNGMHFD